MLGPAGATYDVQVSTLYSLRSYDPKLCTMLISDACALGTIFEHA